MRRPNRAAVWHVCGTTRVRGPVLADMWSGHPGCDLGFLVGAGEGNRTLMTSLEGWGSAIELRPRVRWELCLGTGEHGQRTGSGHRRRTVAADRGGLRPRGRLVHWRCRISAVMAAGSSWEALRRLGSRPMDGRLRIGSTGCGAAWLARLLWEQEAAGSNPAIPTTAIPTIPAIPTRSEYISILMR
jgi:hypothetical protein